MRGGTEQSLADLGFGQARGFWPFFLHGALHPLLVGLQKVLANLHAPCFYDHSNSFAQIQASPAALTLRRRSCPFVIQWVRGIKGKGLLGGSLYPSTERKELVDVTSDSEN